jgi:hypothetical protein
MNKLFLAVLFFLTLLLLVSPSYGQSVYTPGGVNYGGGMIVRETYGTGAPSPSCSDHVRYWQTDASGSNSPMWQCNLQTGTMVNLGAASSGTSFAVTTTAPGLQSMIGPLASTYFQVGNADTTLSRCGAKCLQLGSTTSLIDGTIKSLNFTGNVNNVLNPTMYNASDIGAQVNAAYATCISCTVHVPQGTYSFSTPIVIPPTLNGTVLDMDKNATLNYTGTGCAITTGSSNGANTNFGGVVVQGGTLNGTSAATCGVHSSPGQNVRVTGMLIKFFSAGDGIWVDGTNVVSIDHNRIYGSLNGIHLTGNSCNGGSWACVWTRSGPNTWVHNTVAGAGGFAPNQVTIRNNNISNSGHWGILEMDINPGTSASFGNTIDANDLEGNGSAGANYGAVATCFSAGTSIEHNYFEVSPRQILLGCSGDPGVTVPAGYTAQFGGNAVKPRVAFNYFTSGSTIEVEAHHTIDPIINWNEEAGSGGSSCFVDGTVAVGDIEIMGNTTTAASEVCQGGGAGGYLAAYVDHQSNGQRIFGGDVVVGGNVLANSGGVNASTILATHGASFQSSQTCNNVASISINIGSMKIFSSCANLTGGSCSGAALGISPAGISECKNGTWTNP